MRTTPNYARQETTEKEEEYQGKSEEEYEEEHDVFYQLPRHTQIISQLQYKYLLNKVEHFITTEPDSILYFIEKELKNECEKYVGEFNTLLSSFKGSEDSHKICAVDLHGQNNISSLLRNVFSYTGVVLSIAAIAACLYKSSSIALFIADIFKSIIDDTEDRYLLFVGLATILSAIVVLALLIAISHKFIRQMFNKLGGTLYMASEYSYYDSINQDDQFKEAISLDEIPSDEEAGNPPNTAHIKIFPADLAKVISFSKHPIVKFFAMLSQADDLTNEPAYMNMIPLRLIQQSNLFQEDQPSKFKTYLAPPCEFLDKDNHYGQFFDFKRTITTLENSAKNLPDRMSNFADRIKKIIQEKNLSNLPKVNFQRQNGTAFKSILATRLELTQQSLDELALLLAFTMIYDKYNPGEERDSLSVASQAIYNSLWFNKEELTLFGNAFLELQQEERDAKTHYIDAFSKWLRESLALLRQSINILRSDMRTGCTVDFVSYFYYKKQPVRPLLLQALITIAHDQTLNCIIEFFDDDM